VTSYMWFDGGFVMTVTHSNRGVFEMWSLILCVLEAFNYGET